MSERSTEPINELLDSLYREDSRRILATQTKEELMKCICLRYLEPVAFEGITEEERHAVLDACIENNDHLRGNGPLVAEVPLQPPENAVILFSKNGDFTMALNFRWHCGIQHQADGS